MNEDAKIIAEREKALYAALSTSDADALADIMSDDVTYVHSTGIAETKQENLAGQRSGVHKHGPITRLHGKTQISGDLALTRGVIDMVDTAHGTPFTLRLCESLVWLREAGTWRLLLRHPTRLPL